MRRVTKHPDESWHDWRHRMHEILFEADTSGGRLFDVLLLLTIALSVVAVILESVQSIRSIYGDVLRWAEWTFTILTFEYFLRLACVRRPWHYATSFYRLVDLMAIIPTYLSLFIAGTQSLIVIRALRLLRVFRVLKIARFFGGDYLLGPCIAGHSCKNRRILVHNRHPSADHGDDHVCHRRRRKWFHKYSPRFILGHRHDYDSWVWGCRTKDDTWASGCVSGDDARV